MEQRTDESMTAKGAAKKPRRGSWTMEQKRQIVAESHVAGANMAEVAQRHGVRVASAARMIHPHSARDFPMRQRE